jgi:hypothetical protein
MLLYSEHDRNVITYIVVLYDCIYYTQWHVPIGYIGIGIDTLYIVGTSCVFDILLMDKIVINVGQKIIL